MCYLWIIPQDSPTLDLRLATLCLLGALLDNFAVHFGMKCSSFCKMNIGTSVRSAATAIGFEGHDSVRLANKLLEGAERSHKGQNIIVTNSSLPLIPVNGTEFQHLVSNVLSDVTSTGVASIYAEPGVGKSVAVALAVLGWAKGNPKSITVLVRGRLNLLNDFFRVSDQAYIPAVAASLFPMLSDEGVRLQLVLDDIFDKANSEDWQLLIMLANAHICTDRSS